MTERTYENTFIVFKGFDVNELFANGNLKSIFEEVDPVNSGIDALLNLKGCMIDRDNKLSIGDILQGFRIVNKFDTKPFYTNQNGTPQQSAGFTPDGIQWYYERSIVMWDSPFESDRTPLGLKLIQPTYTTPEIEEEKEMRNKRDYIGLIKAYDKLINNSGMGLLGIRLFKKAYCLSRLYGKVEAQKFLKDYSDNKIPFMLLPNDKELYELLNMITPYFQKIGDSYNSIHLSTIENWLKLPNKYKDALEIVFDYEDILK